MSTTVSDTALNKGMGDILDSQSSRLLETFMHVLGLNTAGQLVSRNRIEDSNIDKQAHRIVKFLVIAGSLHHLPQKVRSQEPAEPVRQ